MRDSETTLLNEIDDFLSVSNLSATAFGEKVMNDRHLVRRLKAGGSVTLKTAAKIRTFIKNWKPPKRGRARPKTSVPRAQAAA